MGELGTQDKHYAYLGASSDAACPSRSAYGGGAARGKTAYEVKLSRVTAATQTFAQVVEVPRRGKGNVQVHKGKLPERYREALQDVR